MKLALSNLAFPMNVADPTLRHMKTLGFDGIEVALTRIAPWLDLTPKLVMDYACRLADLGLTVPSLQAIYFGLDGAALLGNELAFAPIIERTKLVAEYGALLNARIAVFGAPKLRHSFGMASEDAIDLSATRLERLAEICGQSGLILAMEPVPKVYGGDFLERWRDLAHVVRMIANPNFQIHLDIGCVSLGGDDISEAIRECADILAHFHVAERDLGGFENCSFDHVAAGECLRAITWGQWIAIEMVEQSPDNITAIETAAAVTVGAYLQTSSR
jgi:sugar phosphate isomerase/epimerase